LQKKGFRRDGKIEALLRLVKGEVREKRDPFWGGGLKKGKMRGDKERNSGGE